MKWLDKVIDEVVAAHAGGQIIIQSGVSPSGTYHVGTLREVLISDAILRGLRQRGRQAKHIHYVDDMDVLRKLPADLPADYQKFLGQPYCDIPAPQGEGTYADFFLNDFFAAAHKLELDMEVIRSHQQYRTGQMTEAIEKALAEVDRIRHIISDISGRRVDDNWAPIQVMEGAYLKNRQFKSMDTKAKTLVYTDAEGNDQTVDYGRGQVKLNWRVDWPARWWRLGVQVEPFGRDHATKGGSYDTGAAIVKQIFGAEPPLPVHYNFINYIGQTKKMSKSAGNVIAMSAMADILPPEVVRYFTLRYSPDKQLFFDEAHGIIKLMDEYAALKAKDPAAVKAYAADQPSVVSSIPFSHLVISYQAALGDEQQTLEVVRRTEYGSQADRQAATVRQELAFIGKWLDSWAPADIKFDIQKALPPVDLTADEKDYLAQLADKVAAAPDNADGEWFHKTIYAFKDSLDWTPEAVFRPIYQVLINKDAGPRAGWFLSNLNLRDHDWLVKRLRLEA